MGKPQKKQRDTTGEAAENPELNVSWIKKPLEPTERNQDKPLIPYLRGDKVKEVTVEGGALESHPPVARDVRLESVVSPTESGGEEFALVVSAEELQDPGKEPMMNEQNTEDIRPSSEAGEGRGRTLGEIFDSIPQLKKDRDEIKEMRQMRLEQHRKPLSLIDRLLFFEGRGI